MTTPNASSAHAAKHPLTSHSIATPPTVAHLPNFSPAPRSVPSPATQRGQQADRSPFTAANHAASVGSTATAMNHPTTSSSGKGGSGMGGLLGSSPIGLDIATPIGHIATPAGLGVGLGALGGIDMGIGLSLTGSQTGLGMSLSMGAGASDEDRRKRLEKVIDTIRHAPGRVSDEGIERLAQRCGMAVQCDPPIAKGEGDGVRQLAIAGETLLIEIQSQNDKVQTVSVQWPEQNEEEYAKSAAELLKGNLTAQDGVSSINFTLDKFAQNLERLSRLDSLEGPNFNCFEAISGVYASLKRLYEHERKAALELIEEKAIDRNERALREVMCRKSGRPRLNQRERIGLSIDYWKDDRFVFPGTSQDPEAMDTGDDHSHSSIDDSLYSLIVDCESHPASLYTPVRSSNDWLSSTVEKKVDEHGVFSQIDWQEPPPTLLHNPHEASSDQLMNDLGVSSKQPNIRFVARLDPPLAIPSQVAYYVMNSVGNVSPDTTEHLRPMSSSYDGLVLSAQPLDEIAEQTAVSATGLERQHHAAGLFVIPASDSSSSEGRDHDKHREHKQTLYTKPEFGALLKDFPFSHPSQIVALLPLLRQYAFLNSLLRRGFKQNKSLPGAVTSLDKINGIRHARKASSEALRIDLMLKVAPLIDLTLQGTIPPPPPNPQLSITFRSPSAPTDAAATDSSVDANDSNSTVERTQGGIDTLDDLLAFDSMDDDAVNGRDDDNDVVMVMDGDSSAAGAVPPREKAKGSRTHRGQVSLTLDIAPNAVVGVTDQNIVPPLSLPAVTEGAPKDGKTAAATDGPRTPRVAKTEGDAAAGEKKDDDDKQGGEKSGHNMEGITKSLKEHHELEDERLAKISRLGRALEVAGDLGVWAEWIGMQTYEDHR